MLYHNVYNIIPGVGRVLSKTMGGVTLLFHFYFHTCFGRHRASSLPDFPSPWKVNTSNTYLYVKYRSSIWHEVGVKTCRFEMQSGNCVPCTKS